MNTTTADRSTYVTVDGLQYRQARKLAGLEIADVIRIVNAAGQATGVTLSRSRLTLLELGHKPRTRPSTFAALCDAIGIEPSKREHMVAEASAA